MLYQNSGLKQHPSVILFYLKMAFQNEFPAVVQEPVSQRIYYFSGDFANSKFLTGHRRFKGIDKLKGILYSDKPDDTRRFFWLYYKPLINGYSVTIMLP